MVINSEKLSLVTSSDRALHLQPICTNDKLWEEVGHSLPLCSHVLLQVQAHSLIIRKGFSTWRLLLCMKWHAPHLHCTGMYEVVHSRIYTHLCTVIKHTQFQTCWQYVSLVLCIVETNRIWMLAWQAGGRGGGKVFLFSTRSHYTAYYLSLSAAPAGWSFT